ncbi:condensation domain-containing protein, partial [Melissospora conviva]|uniref:condensation domain-containing protein n=1 Tax=Melissospora conviva TaxID=3388432 RepID=UPI003F7F1797
PRVLPVGGVPVVVAEVPDWPAAVREAAEFVRVPFDLVEGPVVRAGLFRVSSVECLFVVAVHHIAFDGWSLGVFARELSVLYGGGVLPPLGVQYVDFAVWQRGWLADGVVDEQLRYWRERLAGVAPVVDLPVDRPRPVVQSFRGARVPVVLSGEVMGRVRGVCAAEGVTVFMFLLAAWKVLLARCSGQRDVVVGVPVAGRPRVELESLVGFFVNTLVLRTDVGGDLSVREVLGRVRESAVGAFAHQDVPFERLVEELSPRRELSYSPLFQVLFVLQNAPLGELACGGARLEPVDVDLGTAKFDLTLDVREVGDGVVGSLEYSVDVFDEATAVAFVERFGVLVDGMSLNPDT